MDKVVNSTTMIAVAGLMVLPAMGAAEPKASSAREPGRVASPRDQAATPRQSSDPAPPETPGRGRLVVDIVDLSNGSPTPARVRLRDRKLLSYHKPESRIRIGGRDLEVSYRAGESKEELFYSPPHFEVELPSGTYELQAEKGFEYHPFAREFTFGADQTVTLRVELTRWVDMAREGWMSGDYHNHFDRTSPGSTQEILEIMKAEDLKVAHSMVSLLGGKLREPQPNFGRASLASKDGHHLVSGEEFIHDKLGHLAFIDIPKLIEPVGTGARRRTDTKADFPINYLVAKQAREAGGTVFACHGGAGEFPIDLALGVIDGIEVLQGSKWVRVTDSGRDLLLAPNWYHALNCGFRLPGVAASDYAYLTHKVVNLECNYVYVRDRFTPDAWLEGLKAGRAFMVKGPMMLSFTVNGQMMGETVRLEQPEAPVELNIRLRALFPFEGLQIIRNGVVIREIANREGKCDFEYREKMPVRRSCWFAVRVFAPNRVDPVRGDYLAHSNPVHVEVAGQPVLVAESVIWWLDKIDDLIAWAGREAIFDRPEDKRQTIEIFQRGRACYERLLARCRVD